MYIEEFSRKNVTRFSFTANMLHRKRSEWSGAQSKALENPNEMLDQAMLVNVDVSSIRRHASCRNRHARNLGE